MNSFRAVERALAYEENRQRQVLERGNEVPQETRGWVEAKGITVSQRTKERAHDYRYFPEPDLPPLSISAAKVAVIKEQMPELPAGRRERMMAQFGLSEADAELMTAEKGIADYYEETVSASTSDTRARTAANWILNDLFGLQRERGLPADQLPLTTTQLNDLLDAIDSGALTARAAKELLIQIQDTELPSAAAKRLNLLSLNDDEALRTAVTRTLAAFPNAVNDYRSGKKAAIGRLIGETIKATGGRARPDDVRRLLEEALAAEDHP
jgi:aspartyl-tRNA(Asn)/glutamyl-tRNA(Gln) amidotransferase subunit B